MRILTPAWYHGDLLAENLLVADDGRLCAVLDFGTLGVGDPSVDLVAAWEVLDPESRATFRRAVDVDDATWQRANGLGALHRLRDLSLLLGHDARPVRRPSGDGTHVARDRVATSSPSAQ